MAKKYCKALADADIMYNYGNIGRIDVLNILFDKIYLPPHVYGIELRSLAGEAYLNIHNYMNKCDGLLLIDGKDRVLIGLAKPIIREKYDLIGKGESECAGYASALGTPFILSDNISDAKWLNEYIVLTYYDVLFLCNFFRKISRKEAIDLYNNINSSLQYPSKIDFDKRVKRRHAFFKEKGWVKTLGI